MGRKATSINGTLIPQLSLIKMKLITQFTIPSKSSSAKERIILRALPHDAGLELWFRAGFVNV